MENFRPFSLSGNNAFLSVPSRKGMTQWKAIRAYEEIYKADAKVAMGGAGAAFTKASRILEKDKDRLMKEIAEACELNNVDSEKARRAGLSSTRSGYYRKFWQAAKKQDIEKCNRYAEALITLGVRPKGFKQSFKYRREALPEKAREIGIEAFRRARTK
jgi:hypothetical protein